MTAKDHPARAQLRLIRPLLPDFKPAKLLGPIVDPRLDQPKWTLGSMAILATVQPAADDSPWYHVSYSFADRCPTHDETCAVRSMMFRPDALVVAVFPPVDEYVNHMPFCLHLWQRIGGERLIPDLRVSDPRISELTI